MTCGGGTISTGRRACVATSCDTLPRVSLAEAAETAGSDDDDRRVELVGDVEDALPCRRRDRRARLGVEAGAARVRRAGLRAPERVGPVHVLEGRSRHERRRRRDALGERERRCHVQHDCAPRAEKRGGRVDRPLRVVRAVVADEDLRAAGVYALGHGRRLLSRFVRRVCHVSCRLAMPAWTISTPTHIATSAAIRGGSIVCILLSSLASALRRGLGGRVRANATPQLVGDE